MLPQYLTLSVLREKLSMEDTIRNYTFESAYAEFAENKKTQSKSEGSPTS